MGFFEKIKKGLAKTKNALGGTIDNVLSAFGVIDDDLYDELEETLIMADIGVKTSSEIIERLRRNVKEKKIKDAALVKDELKNVLCEILTQVDCKPKLDTKPSIILLIGVNGVGKTTTAAKLANIYKQKGKKVIFGAADTFRAAAGEQLEMWAERVGVDIIKSVHGADPAAVVYDTISAAKARGSDVIICDTAGRLHNKVNLMNELAKIYKVISGQLPDADTESLLVLDAATGQNAMNQAREFGKSVALTGAVLTKLDGTAKGGMALALMCEYGLPIKFIGVGEQMDDMQEFNAEEFVNALFD
ncbi:MAG: signal recognition particle-docking protein FtsY [Clostridia bacterium]|nr:signal recognition particle-docking protein FtsY [Clostridia bacterium]